MFGAFCNSDPSLGGLSHRLLQELSWGIIHILPNSLLSRVGSDGVSGSHSAGQPSPRSDFSVFSRPGKAPIPVAVPPRFPLPLLSPSPLSVLWLCLLRTFPVNGLAGRVVFGGLLSGCRIFSRCTRVVACVSVSFLIRPSNTVSRGRQTLSCPSRRQWMDTG